MLSIGAMKGGQHSYYLELSREDYYVNGGEPPGVWHGQGAADLALSGIVSSEALTRLFAGIHPTEDRGLIQNSEDPNHQSGWDLTFSAPKSVSVLWSQSDEATRRAIHDAHFAGVKAALNYLEDEIATTRTGKGGVNREQARLIVATFEHHTSRALDPQLHTHALVMNVCTDVDGQTRTLESKPLYQAKMAAGAVYRAEFAAHLERNLNLTIERRGSVFEIEGPCEKLIAEFSKRRADIEAALAEKGFTSAAAAAVAALSTREVKGHVSQEELFPKWHEVGRAIGWGPERAARLIDEAIPRTRDRRAEMETALGKTAERATEQQSYFTVREFTRYLAEEAQGRGIGASELRAARNHYFSHSGEIVSLGRHRSGDLVYTTQEMMRVEKALLDRVEQSKDFLQTGVSGRTAGSVIASRTNLANEQAMALRHVTQDGGSIRIVSGMAGTGKTTFLRAARLAWELEGFEVYGAALGGKAAQGLTVEAGIKSETLKRTLLDLQHGWLKLHAKSVIVVDEGGMVGTRMMGELVAKTERAGARLVLVGEATQLQSIEAGGAFAEMVRRLSAVTLVEIRRQREEWARDAVRNFASGYAAAGLRAYAERGLVTIESDRRKAMESLIEAWKVQGVRNPQVQLILAGTRKETAILNRMAQEERRRVGCIEGDGVAVPGGGEKLYTGDRVLFTKKSRLLGVENGSLGKVVAADAAEETLTVRLDNGERVRLSLSDYQDVKPGYAMTTHKAQGATTERCFILAGGSLQDREISYVQMSRSRGETRIFTDAEEAGEGLTRLVRQMSQSRQKEMAATVERRNAPDRGHEPDHARVSAPDDTRYTEPDHSHDIGF